MAFPIIPKRRSGSAGNPTTLQLGELAVNTLDGELYLGGDGGVMLLNGPVAAGTTVTEHTGDGTTVAFTFGGFNGTADGGYLVSVGGIDQPPSTYSISNTAGGTITFVEAPVAGELISIRAVVAGGGGGSGDATSLQGKEISTTSPTNNELLQWDETAQKWTPNNNTLFGRNPTGTSESVAIGAGVATDTKSVSVGFSSKAFNDGVAVGNNARASFNDIGGAQSICIGKDSLSNYGGIAFGEGAISSGELSINVSNATLLNPSNPTATAGWLTITINGTGYFIPLFQ